MLLDFPNEIIIKFIYLIPKKLINLCKKINNIIDNDSQLMKFIIKKFYYNFNLIKCYSNEIFNIRHNFKSIKNISYFFQTNLSSNEKLLLLSIHNLSYKKYFWFDKKYESNSSYINFYILYYTLLEFETLADSLNIYVDNNHIIYTSNNSNFYNSSNTHIKNYLLYRCKNKSYKLIIKPDNFLDYPLHLLNKIIID